MKYAKTQDQLASILGMSARQLRKYTKRDDAPQPTKSGWNVEKFTKYVREIQSAGLSGDGTLRDEKILRECKRLDIIIEKEAGQLVEYDKALREFAGRLTAFRTVIESWRQHQSAKNPQNVEVINLLADDLLAGMVDA